MKKNPSDKVINILGKPYQVKCPDSEVTSLQQAAYYLEQKMLMMKKSGDALNYDGIAIITALNMAHQLLSLENQSINQNQLVQNRLRELQNKIEKALSPQTEMELEATE